MKQKSTQRIVAVKELSYYSKEEKATFFQEAFVMRDVYRIVQQASSSSLSQSSDSQPPFIHVVEPLGYFINEEGDKAYLVLEFCSNGDMRKYINDMRKMGADIKDERAFELIGQIVSAVNQLHDINIIHGDVKPENILMTEDFRIKLSDFGLARKLQEGREYITHLGGSTLFLSPELLQSQSTQSDGTRYGKKEPQKLVQTRAADIYSIGVMLFELLAQRNPFIDNNEGDISLFEIITRIINEEPAELPSHYSDSLKNLIKRMLAKDPSRRITAEAILEFPEVAASLTKK
ncbi:MAG: putative NEK protein kinase [Streblomastix strix]|uniref:non-specific serine/threonine protein kinase n=1 Tax=Streblomastix strix TaxID=222440 RepID=A0A5J4VH35_9EUKA|nr:MAG: putative NEK protein kinase [Streblomastix strix]